MDLKSPVADLKSRNHIKNNLRLFLTSPKKVELTYYEKSFQIDTLTRGLLPKQKIPLGFRVRGL